MKDGKINDYCSGNGQTYPEYVAEHAYIEGDIVFVMKMGGLKLAIVEGNYPSFIRPGNVAYQIRLLRKNLQSFLNSEHIDHLGIRPADFESECFRNLAKIAYGKSIHKEKALTYLARLLEQ